MKVEKYQYLIGLSKKQIIIEMGDEFNFYPSQVWFYKIKRDWIGRNWTLLLYFENDNVINIKIKKQYSTPKL